MSGSRRSLRSSPRAFFRVDRDPVDSPLVLLGVRDRQGHVLELAVLEGDDRVPKIDPKPLLRQVDRRSAGRRPVVTASDQGRHVVRNALEVTVPRIHIDVDLVLVVGMLDPVFGVCRSVKDTLFHSFSPPVDVLSNGRGDPPAARTPFGARSYRIHPPGSACHGSITKLIGGDSKEITWGPPTYGSLAWSCAGRIGSACSRLLGSVCVRIAVLGNGDHSRGDQAWDTDQDTQQDCGPQGGLRSRTVLCDGDRVGDRPASALRLHKNDLCHCRRHGDATPAKREQQVPTRSRKGTGYPQPATCQDRPYGMGVGTHRPHAHEVTGKQPAAQRNERPSAVVCRRGLVTHICHPRALADQRRGEAAFAATTYWPPLVCKVMRPSSESMNS